MSDKVYKCSAKNCDKTYKSPVRLSTKFPPTHEHSSKRVYTMKEVLDGEEKTPSA